MYVGRTRLMQISTGTVVAQWPAFVRTRAGVLLLLDATTRQTVQATPGDYALDYQLACYYRIRVVGRRRDGGALVLEYDVWQSKADADAGLAPVWVNTHTFIGRPKAWPTLTRLQKFVWFRRCIQDAILDAAFRDRISADVDQHIVADPPDDADDAAIDGVTVELT